MIRGFMLRMTSKSNQICDPILDQDFVPQTTFTQAFLQSILSSIDSKDPVVANAWLETLLDVIDLLPVEVIKSVIFPIVIRKAQLSQPVTSRLSCCKLVGKICPKFEPYLIKKEILPIVQSLAQDVDHEVRACMASQLTYVAQSMDLEAVGSAILPELVELCKDEETLVRLAAIEAVVNMLSCLDDGMLIDIIIPLVQKFTQSALHKKDDTLIIVSNHFGRLCEGLAKKLDAQQKSLFLDLYRQLADLGSQLDVEFNGLPMPDVVPEVRQERKYLLCRESCAFNLTPLASFCGPRNFKTELHSTVSKLVSDVDWSVRYSVSINIVDMLEILGTEGDCLRGEVVGLLKDSCLEVLHGVLVYLPRILEMLAKCGAWSSEAWISDLSSALIQCDETTSQSTKWRLNAQLLQTMSCLSVCLPSSHIYSVFVPFLFEKIVNSRPLPCRLAAAQTLLSLLKHIPNVGIQEAICQQVIRDLKEAKGFYTRKMFISICRMALVMFSDSFFKQHFFRSLLDLHSDPVPNIRLMICDILPDLKSTLLLPKDKSLLQLLETSVRDLMKSEKDRDVESSLRHAIDLLAEIEVPIGQTGPGSTKSSDDGDLEIRWMGKDLKQDDSRSNVTNINPGSLDPTTDEFYIDAGVRIAADVNKLSLKCSSKCPPKQTSRSVCSHAPELRKVSADAKPVRKIRSEDTKDHKTSVSFDRQSRCQPSPAVSRRRSWQTADKLPHSTRSLNTSVPPKNRSSSTCSKYSVRKSDTSNSGTSPGKDIKEKEIEKNKSRSQENLPLRAVSRKFPSRRSSMIEDTFIGYSCSVEDARKLASNSYLQRNKPKSMAISSVSLGLAVQRKINETKLQQINSQVKKRTEESTFKRNHPNRSSLPIPRPVSIPTTKLSNSTTTSPAQSCCSSPMPVRKRHSSYLDASRVRIASNKGIKK